MKEEEVFEENERREDGMIRWYRLSGSDTKLIRPKNGTVSRYGFDKNSEGRTDGSLGLTKGAERPSIFPCLIVAWYDSQVRQRDGSQSVAGCDSQVQRERENRLELTTPSNQDKFLKKNKESKNSSFIKGKSIQNEKLSYILIEFLVKENWWEMCKNNA